MSALYHRFKGERQVWYRWFGWLVGTVVRTANAVQANINSRNIWGFDRRYWKEVDFKTRRYCDESHFSVGLQRQKARNKLSRIQFEMKRQNQFMFWQSLDTISKTSFTSIPLAGNGWMPISVRG